MLRLIHRDPELPKTQAHVSAPLAARPTQESIDLAKRMAAPNRQAGGTLKSLDPVSVLKTEKGGQREPSFDPKKETSGLEVRDKKDSVKRGKGEAVETPMEISEPLEREPKDIKVEFVSFRLKPVASFCALTEILCFFQLGDRNALVFNQAGAKALPRDELPDNFFDLTVEDAKHLLKDAVRLRAELEEAPLLTLAQRKLDEDKRVLHNLHKYRRTVIRIQFPDQLVLQGIFGPLETVETIKNFVKIYLTDPNAEFVLCEYSILPGDDELLFTLFDFTDTTPPRTVLDTNARLVDLNLVPSAIMYYSGQSALKPELQTKLTDPRAAGIQAVKSR